jgi:hypothetical protein
VLTGGDAHRLHEELIVAGGEIREGRFARLNVGQTDAALNAARAAEAPPAVKARLATLWPTISGPLLAALEARMRDRVGGLERQLADRSAKEQADIRAILTELARAIEAELRPSQERQLVLEGFGPDELAQLERNRTGLETRLAEIPGEIEQEVAAIKARFSDVTPRLFPVAVTFLVPERVARELERSPFTYPVGR